MADLQVLVIYNLTLDQIQRVRDVDPRLHVDSLSRLEALFLRDRPLPEGSDAIEIERGLAAKLAQAQVILGWDGDVGRALERCPALQWAQLSSAGADQMVESPVFRGGRVTVTTASGIASTNIAEYIIGAILMLAKRMPRSLRQQVAHEWDRTDLELTEVQGQTLGIIGYGAIARETARRARAFGMQVIAVRRSITKPSADDLVDRLLPLQMLPDLLAASDYVALALPLTAESERLLGEAELRMMKPAACLINIARGSIVDERALVHALREGWIAGAVLDVFEEEPLPAESPLWDMKNVIITPHIAGTVEQYAARVAAIFCDNLRRYLAGEPLLNVMDPGRGY